MSAEEHVEYVKGHSKLLAEILGIADIRPGRWSGN